MKEQKETFADICDEFIGKPWSRTGYGPDSYSCVGLCYAFLKRTGKSMDEQLWNGSEIKVENYQDFRDAKPKETVEILMRIFSQIGEEISVNNKIAGDFIIWTMEDGRFHPGIYVGNGMFMASYVNSCVKVFSLKKDKISVVKVRRL